MNVHLLMHEWLVIGLGLLVLLADLWLPSHVRTKLGYGAAAGLALILLYSLFLAHSPGTNPQFAFARIYVMDDFALFFKRFFLIAALLVMLISVEFSDRFSSGVSEFYAIQLFALAGMLFAASANDFTLLFVALELITVSFYVLVGFQRSRLSSLEAGVKYLIIGAISTGFTVFGIALVTGVSGKMNFHDLAAVAPQLATNRLFLFGLLLIMVGLGFKIAAFPFQIWAPDVYQGAPSPTTAFLAVGSKAAGFALLLRVLFTAVPSITAQWSHLLIIISAITILYGNLGALPQRGVKRLLGYSSVAQAGYMLMGIAALSSAGASAIPFYLGGYLFTIMAAFIVICVVMRAAGSDDVSLLEGLNRRSPLMAAAMLMAMVSLAGIPPLAGFFGKFLLITAALAQAPSQPALYWLCGIAIAGVIISLYYYFGIIRAMYWPGDIVEIRPLILSRPIRFAAYACMAGMLVLGVYPGPLLKLATQSIQMLK